MDKVIGVKRFTIKRSKWGQKYLRRETDGRRCCLGFYLEACGVSSKDTRGCEMPANFVGSSIEEKIPNWLMGQDADRLAEINDDPCRAGLTRSDKEKRIKEIFKNHGVEVRFVG